jgi:hypothetical protein
MKYCILVVLKLKKKQNKTEILPRTRLKRSVTQSYNYDPSCFHRLSITVWEHDAYPFACMVLQF